MNNTIRKQHANFNLSNYWDFKIQKKYEINLMNDNLDENLAYEKNFRKSLYLEKQKKKHR